jgi:hypothetical protein
MKMYYNEDEHELSQDEARSMDMTVEDGFRFTDLRDIQKLEDDINLGLHSSFLKKRMDKVKENHYTRNKLRY